MGTDYKKLVEFTESLSEETRADILYRHLVLGESTRKIERQVFNESGSGWKPWEVQQVYGFNGSTKGTKKYEINNPKFKEQIRESVANYDISNLDKEVGNVELEEIDEPVSKYSSLDGTDALIEGKTRIGQLKLRNNILKLYDNQCAFCNISHPKLLVASHIKPWAKSSKEERVDNSNAILLCGTHDKLFDRGFITLDDNFKIIINKNKVPKKYSPESIGLDINTTFRRPLNFDEEKTRYYLDEHRKHFKIKL